LKDTFLNSDKVSAFCLQALLRQLFLRAVTSWLWAACCFSGHCLRTHHFTWRCLIVCSVWKAVERWSHWQRWVNALPHANHWSQGKIMKSSIRGVAFH